MKFRDEFDLKNVNNDFHVNIMNIKFLVVISKFLIFFSFCEEHCRRFLFTCFAQNNRR
jgi:hypothetical protein